MDCENMNVGEQTGGKYSIAPDYFRKKICDVCKNEIDKSAVFCPVCGKVQIENVCVEVEKMPEKKGKRRLIFGLCAVCITVAVMVLISLLTVTNFKKTYPLMDSSSWCRFSYGGYVMTIDTNPENLTGYNITAALEAVRKINNELGFDSSVYQQMVQTSSQDGECAAECENYKVSWSYSPYTGLVVIYKNN